LEGNWPVPFGKLDPRISVGRKSLYKGNILRNPEYSHLAGEEFYLIIGKFLQNN
jgi:hypothetical protein